jgi:hypothetical protein
VIRREGWVLGTFVEGLKEGIEGIQEVDQIRRCEVNEA